MKVVTAKALAASRQLDVSIELLFSDREPLAVRTLAAAAHAVFADLVEHKRPGESWRNRLIQDSGLPRDAAINVLNGASNFLKHADRDPEDELSFEEEENDYLIFFATLECGELGHQLSLTMQAFQVWYLACHPEHIGESEEIVRKAKTAFPEFSNLERQARLKEVLQFLPSGQLPVGFACRQLPLMSNVEPTLRVVSTALRMVIRRLAREARSNQRLQWASAAQTSFTPRPPLIRGAVTISCYR